MTNVLLSVFFILRLKLYYKKILQPHWVVRDCIQKVLYFLTLLPGDHKSMMNFMEESSTLSFRREAGYDTSIRLKKLFLLHSITCPVKDYYQVATRILLTINHHEKNKRIIYLCKLQKRYFSGQQNLQESLPILFCFFTCRLRNTLR